MQMLLCRSKLRRSYGNANRQQAQITTGAAGHSLDPGPLSRYMSAIPIPSARPVTPEGTNFSVFSANATRMEIVFFDHADDPQPSRVIHLDPVLHRTSHYWHIFVPEIKPGQLYGYRADGPYDPPAGQRFDRHKVLLDPYGKSVPSGSTTIVPLHASRGITQRLR